MAPKIDFIHQWQAVGRVNPELLKDEALDNCKKIGLTSLQSYVYWAEIEKRPGKIDFSTYDELVERLESHGLKWVPFLITGPQYATPEWFQNGPKSVYARCLEHGKETKIQSIWNPNLPKYVDRFLGLVHRHYSGSGIVESVMLGISGNWGESLFPATGGFNRPDGFHTHPGWWCGDRYAISDFKKFVKDKHGSARELGRAWGKEYRSFDQVNYPKVTPGFSRWFAQSMKNLAVFGMKTLSGRMDFWDRASIGLVRLRYPHAKNLEDRNKREQWLDFVQWYTGSMTKWAEFWVKTARKYFDKVYLAVGGDGNAMLGADFSRQAKIAARSKAGLRVTNQEDDYAKTFVLSRWVSSACKFYGARYATEEAWHNLPEGITSRLFEAATSGAAAAYFKDLISEDIDSHWTKYPDLGWPTECAEKFVKNSQHVTGKPPIVEAAVLLPDTSFDVNPLVLNSIYSKSMRLRDVLDFDYVDENMIEDGALGGYRFLVLLDGNLALPKTLSGIKKWVELGGILIDPDVCVCGTDGVSFSDLFGAPSAVKRIKRGYWARPSDKRNPLDFINEAVHNLDGEYPWKGLPEIDTEMDGVYAARPPGKILYYNSNRKPVVKKVEIKNLPKKVKFELNLKPDEILEVKLGSKPRVLNRLE